MKYLVAIRKNEADLWELTGDSVPRQEGACVVVPGSACRGLIPPLTSCATLGLFLTLSKLFHL